MKEFTEIYELAVECMFEEITIYYSRDAEDIKSGVERKLSDKELALWNADVYEIQEQRALAYLEAIQDAELFYAEQEERETRYDLSPQELLKGFPA